MLVYNISNFPKVSILGGLNDVTVDFESSQNSKVTYNEDDDIFLKCENLQAFCRILYIKDSENEQIRIKMKPNSTLRVNIRDYKLQLHPNLTFIIDGISTNVEFITYRTSLSINCGDDNYSVDFKDKYNTISFRYDDKITLTCWNERNVKSILLINDLALAIGEHSIYRLNLGDIIYDEKNYNRMIIPVTITLDGLTTTYHFCRKETEIYPLFFIQEEKKDYVVNRTSFYFSNDSEELTIRRDGTSAMVLVCDNEGENTLPRTLTINDQEFLIERNSKDYIDLELSNDESIHVHMKNALNMIIHFPSPLEKNYVYSKSNALVPVL